MESGARANNWIGTLNNPDTTAEEHLNNIFSSGKVIFTVGQLEVGVDGTEHIQYYVNLKTA